MPVTTDVYTVQTGHQALNFRLETQIHLGEFQATPGGRAATSKPIQWECTYLCEQCEHVLATYVGTPGQTSIPADVVESMMEHSQKHQ
jgi:hypothetical protein